MTSVQVLRFVYRWLWLCLLGVLLCGVVSYVLSIRLPKIYEGTVKLLVAPNPTASGAVDYNTLLAAQNLTITYAELAKTRPVVNAALHAAGIDLEYEQAIGWLDASPVRNTQLLQLTARGSDPDQAAAFANLLAAALVHQSQASQSTRFAASRDGLTTQLDRLNADIAGRTEQLDRLRAQPPTAERDGQLTRTQLELAQLQQTYATVERSYEDVNLAEARNTDILVVVDPATPSPRPVQPQVLRNVVLAAFVGLLIGAGAAFMVESLDDRLVSPKQVARFTGLPVLGTVGQQRKDGVTVANQVSAVALSQIRQSDLNSRAEQTKSLSSETPTLSASGRYHVANAAEPFRLLSANLQVASVERRLRALLVTSCGVGEGKTTTATNLALVLAQAGKEVVLVDADLRAPALHKVFGVENRIGLTSLLMHDDLAAASILVQTHVEGLRLLPSGPLPADPTELLASQRMRGQLAQLCELADMVIVDSSPVLAASDPAVLAGLVDGVLLVANARRTRGQDATDAIAALRNAGAWVVGMVLNRVPQGGARYGRSSAQAYEADLRPTTE